MTATAPSPSLSPNCGPRRDGLTPTLVVLHHTAMATADAAVDRLCDPAAEVSAHHLITRTGAVIQLVPEDLRAWHAGAGEWHGVADINSRSIGIELDNDGKTPFAAAQMDALEILLSGILTRWSIAPDGVIAHSDMAPGRKRDPGPRFDWLRLERAGLAGQRGEAREPKDTSPDHFAELARKRGYTSSVPFDTLLASVRLRFRPWATGPLAPEDFIPLGPEARGT